MSPVIRDVIEEYIQRGWAVVPLVQGEKKARLGVSPV
jgi:hypothetical protein